MELQSPLGLEITEPIINSNQVAAENNMNNYKIDFNQNEADDLSIVFPSNYIMILIYGIFGGFAYLKVASLCGTLGILLGIFYILFFMLLSVYFVIFKMKINKSNNIINVNFKNIYGCDKIIFKGNIHFYYGTILTKKQYKSSVFFVINDANFSLSTESIKINPARLFYVLNVVIKEEEYLNIKKRFEPANFENPLLFDIAKYMGKNRDPLDDKNQSIVNTLMKFGDHFYTLYLISPLENQSLDYDAFTLYAYLLNIPFFAFCFILCFTDKIEGPLFLEIISLLLMIIFPIIIFLLCYSCYKCCCSNDTRIDFIYSKDFDKIFIGIVNSKQNRYSKTFEYQMDEIERFFVQQSDALNGNSTFKVVLKNKRIDEIQQFKGIDKYDQEGLEYILNGKLNN